MTTESFLGAVPETADSDIPGTCDVLVVGAGPAGCSAAIELAKQGVDVVLAEQSLFPRDKTCGGCLNEVTVGHLKELVGAAALADLGAVPLSRFRWRAGSKTIELGLPGGMAVTRFALDDLLWQHAQRSGVKCLGQTRASLQNWHSGGTTTLKSQQDVRDLSARVLINATGLAGQSLLEPIQNARGVSHDMRLPAASSSRFALIGLGTVLRPPTAADGQSNCSLPVEHGLVERGTVAMTSTNDGYVGLASAERGTTIIAAALRKTSVRERGAAATCLRILQSGDLPGQSDLLKALESARWSGTPALRGQPSRQATRGIFSVGDAAGYAEPFTGEGILWAFQTGRSVVPFVLDALATTQPTAAEDGWEAHYRKCMIARQRRCRWLGRALQHDWSRRMLATSASLFPRTAERIVKRTLSG